MKKSVKKVLACLLITSLFINVVYATTKEESVYVKLNNNGDVNNVVVSEHLYDITKDKINDKTELFDIKSIDGNSDFTQDGTNLVWETNGSDIYYQGKYNKDLPINVSVKYYLNGEEKNIDDILGKKGNVKIVLNYENNNSKTMNINGKNEDIYVPYMIITTSILNNADNKNISVSNGRIVDNGVSSIVIALSSPGLYESLDMDGLKDLNNVEISYDTDKFELNPIYSVATTDVFEQKNLEAFDELNDAYSKIDELQSNMDKIVEASKQLSDGASAIDGGITELNNNLKLLVKKYEYYRNQDQNALKEQLIKIVEDNISDITPALEEEITTETTNILIEHKEELQTAMIESLKNNTKAVIEEELESIVNNLNINQIVNNMIKNDVNDVLDSDSEVNSLTSDLKDNINDKLSNIINDEFDDIEDSIDSSMSNDYIASLAEEYGVTYEQAEQIANKVQSDTLNQVKENVNNSNIPDNIINRLNEENYVSDMVNDYVNSLSIIIKNYINNDSVNDEYENNIKEQIISIIEDKMDNDDAYINSSIKEHVNDLINEIINRTVSDLADTYTEEYTGEVVRNVLEKQFSDENIDNTMNEIFNKYDDDVKNKVNILDDTINTLSISMDQLNTGSSLVADGSKQLSDGLDQYNKLGINKISNLVNGKVKSTQERLESIMDLSSEYGLLDDKEESTTGKSKIVFMIDSISSPSNTSTDIKETKTNKTENTKKSLWDKIKGLFS